MNLALRCVRGRCTALHVTSFVRCYSVTGNQRADNALNTISGGRIESWMTKYENLVGLREVKEAQDKVIEVLGAYFSCYLVRIKYTGSQYADCF